MGGARKWNAGDGIGSFRGVRDSVKARSAVALHRSRRAPIKEARGWRAERLDTARVNAVRWARSLMRVASPLHTARAPAPRRARAWSGHPFRTGK